MADAAVVLHERFWSEQHGLHVDEFTADWSVLDPYRGQNSNMHLVEALSTAAAVTGDLSLRGQGDENRRLHRQQGGQEPVVEDSRTL